MSLTLALDIGTDHVCVGQCANYRTVKRYKLPCLVSNLPSICSSAAIDSRVKLGKQTFSQLIRVGKIQSCFLIEPSIYMVAVFKSTDIFMYCAQPLIWLLILLTCSNTRCLIFLQQHQPLVVHVNVGLISANCSLSESDKYATKLSVNRATLVKLRLFRELLEED
jgi:hypothetical protein